MKMQWVGHETRLFLNMQDEHTNNEIKKFITLLLCLALKMECNARK